MITVHTSRNSAPTAMLTQAPLQLTYRLTLAATVDQVFADVADHVQLCAYVPGLRNVEVVHNRTNDAGCITSRICDFGDDVHLIEEIILWQPPTHYAYRALSPNPFGLEDHLSVVSCVPLACGSELVWQHYFLHADLPAIMRLYEEMFGEVMKRLSNRFGHIQATV